MGSGRGIRARLRTPGALLFDHALWPARLLKVVLGSLVVGLAGVLAARIAGRTAGWCTAAVAAVYPPLLANDTVTLTEWNDLFNNESLTSYAEWLVTSGSNPAENFDSHYREMASDAASWGTALSAPGEPGPYVLARHAAGEPGGRPPRSGENRVCAAGRTGCARREALVMSGTDILSWAGGVLGTCAAARSAGGNDGADRVFARVRASDDRRQRGDNVVWLPSQRGREAMVL